MRTVLIVLVVLLVLPAAAPAAAVPDRCRTHSRIVLTSPRIELWDNPRSGALICHRPTGRVTRPFNGPAIVEDDMGSPRVARRALDVAGDFIAYAWQSPEDECGYSGVAMVDARTGAIGYPQFHTCGFYTRFKKVVVKPSGAVAWSERVSILACRARCTAEEMPPNAVLARGRDVDTRSLRATRNGVAWRQAGRLRHAPLR